MSAILGPGMAAPILWTPGKNAFFLQENPIFSIKFRVLGGGLGGGGKCRFYFYGRGDFSDTWNKLNGAFSQPHLSRPHLAGADLGHGRLRATKIGVAKLCFWQTMLLLGHTPQYGWDFPEEIPEKIPKDPGNALRAFPGISLKSTAGMPQTL